jgi:hypothetical protein
MNERIRELMDQAGELAYEEHKAKCLKDGLNPSMPFGNNLMAIFEKFAELIIRECAEACEKNSWMALNGFQRSKQIKEHFGIDTQTK